MSKPARKRWTAAELEGAATVQWGGHWFPVVHVNDTTVTVSWFGGKRERLPIGAISDAWWRPEQEEPSAPRRLRDWQLSPPLPSGSRIARRRTDNRQ